MTFKKYYLSTNFTDHLLTFHSMNRPKKLIANSATGTSIEKREPRLKFILGDQLTVQSPIFSDIHPDDHFVMAELKHEATHVWSTKMRIAYFLSTMRHFHQKLTTMYSNVLYFKTEDRFQSFSQLLDALNEQYTFSVLELVWPGDYRVKEELNTWAKTHQKTIIFHDDPHFYITPQTFKEWAGAKKEIRMEFFYRWMRQKFHILMNEKEPEGGQWNFDELNRQPPKKGMEASIPTVQSFAPDSLTTSVLSLVKETYSNHPGSLELFDWPVTREEALLALDDFLIHRLALFGPYQDAMIENQSYLYHARLSAALNSKLLSPQEIIAAVLQARHNHKIPIATIEGFIRQILGWREFVRGVYWLKMPEFLTLNHLEHQENLPSMYWSGETQMNCMKQSLQQTLNLGYAHHIQRLMVLGLFAQLYQVNPQQIHEWFLSVYTDAVEWVELPNVLGMSQFADGGYMVSKPYVASGNYIQKMSNYCKNCPYNPKELLTENACPFNVLYWDFLITHESEFSNHPRTALQWKHLKNKTPGERDQIKQKAKQIRLALR